MDFGFVKEHAAWHQITAVYEETTARRPLRFLFVGGQWGAGLIGSSGRW